MELIPSVQPFRIYLNWAKLNSAMLNSKGTARSKDKVMVI
jgi:hypothetical protein